jgi:acetyl-CoA synthetase
MRRRWETLSQTNYDLKQGNISIKWFVEGETNICYNALDRHVEAGHGDQVKTNFISSCEYEQKKYKHVHATTTHRK